MKITSVNRHIFAKK